MQSHDLMYDVNKQRMLKIDVLVIGEKYLVASESVEPVDLG